MKKFNLLFTLCIITYGSAAINNIDISIDPNMAGHFKSDGRILIILDRTQTTDPRNNLWPPRKDIIVLAKDIKNRDIKKNLPKGSLKTWDMLNTTSLQAVPPGKYTVQAVWIQERFGLGVNSPGNLYSSPRLIDTETNNTLSLRLSHIIPEPRLASHPLLRKVSMVSDSLSEWWHTTVKQEAAVLLPAGYFKNPDTHYPVRYNIGGYGSRYNRANALVENPDFMRWWMSGKAPQIITVFLDPVGPYGDNYHINSVNNGPYGSALIHELIPYIDHTFRTKHGAKYRFVDGCSTGGWVSLALQLFYPDMFNGCWSYSPDPVDFHFTQLINIYADDNAFYNAHGYAHPSERSILGDPNFSIRDEVAFENIQGRGGSYITSGEQWSAWNALFSSKGANGLPMKIFDGKSGKINKSIARYWQNYDLLHYLRQNWSRIGPRLQGKIYIWMGDMDNYYLNNAMHAFDIFLKQTKHPVSDARIEFSPMQGHCAQYGHRRVLQQIAGRLKTIQ